MWARLAHKMAQPSPFAGVDTTSEQVRFLWPKGTGSVGRCRPTFGGRQPAAGALTLSRCTPWLAPAGPELRSALHCKHLVMYVPAVQLRVFRLEPAGEKRMPVECWAGAGQLHRGSTQLN